MNIIDRIGSWTTARFDRFANWLETMFKAMDQLAGAWLRGWFYVWGDAEQPSADETISAWVGRHAILGDRWALIAERAIDRVFGAGHCRRAIARDDDD